MQIEEINHFVEKQGLESDCQTLLMFNIIWKGKFYFCLPKTKPLFCKEVKKQEGKKKRMDSQLQKSGYTLLYPPPPPLSPSHTHTATGNKTVTYDFAPIISQEGCLYFTLEQRKEAKTINLSCAELSMGSTSTQLCVPPMSVEYGLPAKLLSPKGDCALEAYFGPLQSQGRNRRNVNHPKASP